MVDEVKLPIGINDLYRKDLALMKTRFAQASLAIAGTLTTVGAGLFEISRRTAKTGDQFQKMSERINVSVKTLSEFDHVAGLAGTSIQSIEKSIRRMTRSASDADNGLATASRSFEQLGIDVHDNNGNLKDAETLFLEVLEALRRVDDTTRRAALAQEVFGKSGAEMLNIAAMTGVEVAQLRQEAENLGITFSEIEGKEAAAFNDALQRVQDRTRGLKEEIGRGLIPILTDLFNIVSGVDPTKFDFVKGLDQSGATAYLEELRDRLVYVNQEIESEKKTLDQALLPALRQEKAEINDLIKATERQIAVTQKQEEVRKNIAKTKSESTVLTGTGVLPGSSGLGTEGELLSFNAGINQALQDEEIKNQQIMEELRQQAIDKEIEQYNARFEAEYQAELEQASKIGALQLDRHQYAEKLRKAELAQIERENRLRIGAAQNTASALVSILEAANTVSQGKHKEQFELLKLARYAEAVVNTYAGANQALASVPYPYNIAAAASVIAAGVANIAAISQQNFEGGGTTPSSGGGTPSTSGLFDITEGTVPTLSDGGEQLRPLDVTIQINGFISPTELDDIMENQVIPSLERLQRRNVSV